MCSADELFAKLQSRLAERRPLPEATYRLQFHAGFRFHDASAIVPYLQSLGVSHCYASPYLQARPGSQHGYDITNHRSLNAEIGSSEDYDTFINDLHACGLGQIFDMVPNHMGIAGNGNAWWNDVLENGPASPFAGHFDIAWEDATRPEMLNQVLLPVLGDLYGKVLEEGQLRIAYDGGAFTIHYYDSRFPVAPRTYADILSFEIDELEKTLGDTPALDEFKSILTSISHLPPRGEKDPARRDERHREKEVVKRRLARLTEENAEIRHRIGRTLDVFNGTLGDPASFNHLDRLLNEQAYRLAYWRVASDEINYRRFFDINELAALNMEKPDVFAASHEMIMWLLSHDRIDGLRIDHPDGLFDPKQYLERLQSAYLAACAREAFDAEAAYERGEWADVEPELLARIDTFVKQDHARPLYVVVEKILAGAEDLPDDWLCHGTSGYDFLNVVNGLFVDSSGELPMTKLYRDWIGDSTRFDEMVYQKKYLVLRDALSSELHMLGRQLDRIAQKDRKSRDFTQNSLRFALRQIVACFPVYRSYIVDTVQETDQRYVELAVRRAIKRNPTINRSVFRFVRDMLLLKYPDSFTEADRAEQRRFVGKFQQVTSPVNAKGVEDTAFYIFNRLLSLNEVGGEPIRFGFTPEAVHRVFQYRQQRYPYALSASSTHDTKRSEDVRARLNVLSEKPGEWHRCLIRWSKLNARHRIAVDDEPVPGPNEEYFLYQTLIGAWPLEPCAPEEYDEFIRRIKDYMLKAMNEAKVHTTWINPNEPYNDAIHSYIGLILDPSGNREFVNDIRRFSMRVSHFGMVNSLSQQLVKITAPGVPDIYQGTELWDFSLVDPDNRRPVDYAKRQQMLAEIDESPDMGAMLKSMNDGRIKLFVTSRALRLRQAHPGLFADGTYVPLEVTETHREHLFAFLRQKDGVSAVTIVPRLPTSLNPTGLPLGDVWGDAAVRIPELPAGTTWKNALTGAALTGTTLLLNEVLRDAPVALLLNEP